MLARVRRAFFDPWLRPAILTIRARHFVGFVLTLLCCQQAALAAEYEIPLFVSASNDMQQGFARIVNHSDETGTVSIRAIDDSGRAFEPFEMSLDPWDAMHFNSDHLEMGDSSRGIAGIGGGTGDWRLVLTSDLNIEVLAYVRTVDGFLTSMHDTVRKPGTRHLVPIFNPGSNSRQVSRLRLINPSGDDAEVTITGVDDQGTRTSDVSLSVPAGEARSVTATQLEMGHSSLTGRLDDGSGKWRLFVTSDRDIHVMSLIESATGHLTNLSASTSATDFPLPQEVTRSMAPADQAAFNALVVGKRLATNRITDYIDFLSGGEFDETYRSRPYNGTYVYRNTGPNTATMTLTYQADSCDYQLTFDATSSGSGQYRCNTVSDSVDWRIEEIGGPAAPRAPTVEGTGSTTARLEWAWRVSGGTSYTFDLQLRQKDDVWWSTRCLLFRTASSGQANMRADLSGLESATTYEFRYRYRDSSSCSAAIRSHSGRWSAIGEGRTQNDDGTGGDGGTRHGVGDTITSMPTGRWLPDITSNASVSVSGSDVTIRFSNGGYVVENGIRYTCDDSGGCRVMNRVVELGVIVEATEPASGVAPGVGGALTLQAKIDLQRLEAPSKKSVR